MPVSGVLTSWATPAASSPSEAMRSETRSCSSRCARAVTSSNMTMVPAHSRPGIGSSGTVVMFTSSAVRAAAARTQRHAVLGAAVGRGGSGRLHRRDHRRVEQHLERPAYRLAAAQPVDALERVVPAHHRAVAADHEQAVVERLEDVLVEHPQPIELRGLDVQLAVEAGVLD